MKPKNNENTVYEFTGHFLNDNEDRFERDKRFFEEGQEHIKTQIRLLTNCLEICGEVMLSKEQAINMLNSLL